MLNDPMFTFWAGIFLGGLAVFCFMNWRAGRRRTRDMLTGYEAGRHVSQMIIDGTVTDDGEATPGAPGPGPSTSDWG